MTALNRNRVAGAQRMSRKSGCRFSEKGHAQSKTLERVPIPCNRDALQENCIMLAGAPPPISPGPQ
jgi:hypothetical protein